MGFRFEFDEPIETAFRRITKEQIAKAHKHMAFSDNPAKSVLETRKCMKRLRALNRLYRPALGKSDYSRENARYRDISRLLSQSRDHQATFETIVSLIEDVKVGTKKGGKAKTLKAGLCAVRELVAHDGASNDLGSARGAVRRIDELHSTEASKRRAIALLDEAQQEIGFLRLKGRGFRTVGRGLEMSCTQVVGQFLAARASDDDEVLHEWRKGNQTHWRQLWLFREAWPEFFAFRVSALREVSRILGRHSDLCLVSEFVRAQPSSLLEPKLARAVRKHIKKLNLELRADALDRGLLLFADGGRELSRQVERYWKAAHKQECRRSSAKDRTTGASRDTEWETGTDPFKLSGKLSGKLSDGL